MKRRRGRTLDKDEITLWHHVAKSVKPLPGRVIPALPPEDPAPDAPVEKPVAAKSPPGKQPPKSAKKAPAKSAPKAPPSIPSKIPPLAPIERRQRLALKRGTDSVEAVLDLHGMRQLEAHSALVGFVRRAQRDQKRLVVVVTGKGFSSGEGLDGLFGERGVLRRLVPQWLASPDLRSVVLGYGEAGRHHGGTGALYVRLRRGREMKP